MEFAADCGAEADLAARVLGFLIGQGKTDSGDVGKLILTWWALEPIRLRQGFRILELPTPLVGPDLIRAWASLPEAAQKKGSLAPCQARGDDEGVWRWPLCFNDSANSFDKFGHDRVWTSRRDLRQETHLSIGIDLPNYPDFLLPNELKGLDERARRYHSADQPCN